MPVTPYRPLPLLGNPHLQTILANQLRLVPAPRSRTRLVALPDGDRLALEVSTPRRWRPERPTVVLVHGLTGSHRSSYMVRSARRLYRRGVRVVRFNMRGCGTGEGLARLPYSAGCSDDLLIALRQLRAAPDGHGPFVLVGFSLGGNVVLKLAGELGAEGPALLREVIVFCPAAELAVCCDRMRQPENWLYQRVFVSELRAAGAAKEKAFPELKRTRLPRARLTLWEFDDIYTGPQWGYAGAADYYAHCSARQFVPGIRVSCRIVLAEDDPLIDPSVLDGVDLQPQVRLTKVPGGGHLGFLARPGAGGLQWMDRHLVKWVLRGSA